MITFVVENIPIKMQTVTIELKAYDSLKALHELEKKNLIKIHDHDSLTLPGGEVDADEFIDWISKAEKSESITVNEAKSKWDFHKTILENLI
jgi:biopolymer transport protein ExbD